MSTQGSILAYSDCYDVFDKAMADKAGVRVKFNLEGDARRFILRMHAARVVDRAENSRIYANDHPMYGRSRYDQAVVKFRVHDGHFWAYVERYDAEKLHIESMSGNMPAPESPSPVIQTMEPDPLPRQEEPDPLPPPEPSPVRILRRF